MLQFVALQDFYSEETGSHYIEGLSYKVRPGNEKLRQLAARWQSEGKVAFDAILTQSGQIAGIGRIG